MKDQMQVTIRDLILALQEAGSDDTPVVGFIHGGELWVIRSEEDGVVYVEERVS